MQTFAEADIALILRALKFAAAKHRDQRRKDEDATPYINHPIDVAETLWRVGEVRDIPTLAAAILHDTIEDTDTEPEEIAALFGEEISSLVLEVSDDKTLPKAVRKQRQIEHAAHKSGSAKLIKIADKIHNVHDVSHSPPAGWPLERVLEYLDWSERVVAGLRGVNAALEAYYDKTLEEARARLKRETYRQSPRLTTPSRQA